MDHAEDTDPHCAVCKEVGDPHMPEPRSGVHVHRGACLEAWIQATEEQRVKWVVSLFRQP
jgi:hypothetical protein